MKTSIKISSLALLLLSASAQAQVTLQDFSAVVGGDTFFYGTWEATGNAGGTTSPNAHFVQGSGVFDITGTTSIIPLDDAVSKLEIFAPTTPVSIGSNTYLEVTAQALGTNVASSFTVFLVDSSAKTASATFAAPSFLVGSYSVSTLLLTFQSGFNPNSIDSMIITGGQPSGTARFNFSFDKIAAVATAPIPEPSTYAAIAGLLALGVVAIRRRRALA